ncbi:hypothetical protein GA0070620_0156 [Micromonospora krabiensis]|uniref:Uncharacterized protein n=1 Tax=Micromonospora krabiensis TaxID=307121 RepID=A0A1C3MWK7_9ACTN|nr:hypothetical protein GA0070620_0156 [Micromonospora krabiensis]
MLSLRWLSQSRAWRVAWAIRSFPGLHLRRADALAARGALGGATLLSELFGLRGQSSPEGIEDQAEADAKRWSKSPGPTRDSVAASAGYRSVGT